jgi:hypothetical protein
MGASLREENRRAPSLPAEEPTFIRMEQKREGRPLLKADRRLLRFPADPFRLEEVNLPKEVASAIAGQSVAIEIMAAGQPYTYTFETDDLPNGLPVLIDRAGKIWNDRWRVRTHFATAATGYGTFLDIGSKEASTFFTAEMEWTEHLHMPSWWDLQDAKIDTRGSGRSAREVDNCTGSGPPGEAIRVLWTDHPGRTWRIPANWRRKRIRLPGPEALIEVGVPEKIAEEFGGGL